MKFYNLENAPMDRKDLVFRKSRVMAAVPAIICLGIALMALLVALKIINVPKGFPAVIACLIAVFMGLIGLAFFAQFRSTLKPTNWLLRANQGGVLIKYRSFLNRKLPATDLQVVGIEYSEIDWARKAIEKRTSLGMGNANSGKSETLKYLDFGLLVETSALAQNLQAENRSESAASSHWEDFPVQLMDGGIVRIKWNGVVPHLRCALKEIERHAKIQDAESSSTDYVTARNLAPDELKAKVLKLAASGETMAACELARKALRCSLTEAVQYVEKVKLESV
ncbi:MAG TPA: hypothetical protein VG754_14000 [Verrucomicrobiae bacterium]|nr:hypothetical protein [Verrucomicrobiae bacterium]